MIQLWRLLSFLPDDAVTFIKRHSSARLRLWLRQRFGAPFTRIPDRIWTMPDGRRFHIGPDLAYWPLYMGLEHEPEVTSVVEQLLRPGDTVVDAGANFGWFTTQFARLVGPSGRVYAFEPVPATYARLCEHLALNGLTERVTAEAAAVGDAAGEATIYVFQDQSDGCASLSPLGDQRHRAIQVPVLRLDSYLAAQGVERVELLKCDVEGSELAVLRGCASLLARSDAPIVLVEVNDATSQAFGFTRADIWHYLESLGYDQFYDVVGMRKVSRISACGDLSGSNLICAKQGRVDERLAAPGATRAGSAVAHR